LMAAQHRSISRFRSALKHLASPTSSVMS